MPITLRKSGLAALLAIPALLVALTACSSAPASPGGNGSSESAGTSAPSSMSYSDWQLANVDCMRDQGVDMPDPTGNGAMVQLGGSAQDADAIAAAAQTCLEKLGPAPVLTEEEKADSDAQLQKILISIAECYRKNGIDIADPKPGDQLKAPNNLPEEVLQECGGAPVPAGSANE